MKVLCILLIAAGACMMLYSVIKYYKSLVQLKIQIKARRLFSDFIYAACFVMMIFFLAGYSATAIVFIIEKETPLSNLLISAIFFFGAIFVLAMVVTARRMFIVSADKDLLNKQLKQQELMSAVSQSFTTTEDPEKLIYEALKMSGEFMKADHAFLSKYQREQNVLECISEWCGLGGRPFIGDKNKWPLTPDMDYYKDITGKGYSAINDYNKLSHHNFHIVEDYKLAAFLNISVEVSGEFWGVIGFILYGRPYEWTESDIHLGKLIAGIFSGAILRKTADEELLKAKEDAERESRYKSEFLSRMSHEIRTPMNAVIGMTDIAKNTNDIERKDYCLDKIGSASGHLLGVINDILDMSKIEADKLELSLSDFSLEKALAKIVNIIGFQIEEKKQRFALSVGKDVPETINTDEQRLSQVITNLLSNAVKFTPEKGEISLSVLKTAEENGICTLQFEVKDSGIGISEEQQTRLFRSFEQADGGISRKYGGTGLGLAISKRLVQMMGGGIRCESAAGRGSSFIFDIRAAAGTAALNATDTGALARNTGGKDKSPDYADGCFKASKILVAEDIEINREIVAALLEFTGVKIDFAEDGRKAYDLFTRSPSAYGMIFMDIHMPGTDGYEATRMIRAFDSPSAKTVPIIAMTADVFHEDIKKCLASGMNGHLGKPLAMKEMLSVMAQYLPL